MSPDKKGKLSLKLKSQSRQQKQQCLALKSNEKSEHYGSVRPCSGLSNLGNTCYCNAVLQALRHCTGFTSALSNRHSVYAQRNLLQVLKQLMQEMEESIRTVSPATFLDVLRQSNGKFSEGIQHDAQELLNYLLAEDLLLTQRKRKATSPLYRADKLMKTNNGMTCTEYVRHIAQPCQPQCVAALFQGKLALVTRCFDCEACTNTTEPFLHTSSSSSAAAVSLSWCLSRLMSQERLAQNNKYWCNCCGHLVEAERKTVFSELPSVFTVHLNRFSMHEWGRTVGKVTGNVAIPLSLSLSPWTTPNCAYRNTVYCLQTVVLHTGTSCHSGHYTAMVWAAEQWLLCDDENVTVLPETTALELLSPLSVSSASPYILFYSRL